MLTCGYYFLLGQLAETSICRAVQVLQGRQVYQGCAMHVFARLKEFSFFFLLYCVDVVMVELLAESLFLDNGCRSPTNSNLALYDYSIVF